MIEQPKSDPAVSADGPTDAMRPGERASRRGKRVVDPRWPRSFAHHGLDVYHVAFDAMLGAVALSERVPRGYRSFADQLKRSSTAVVAAIGEAANRRTSAEKADKFGQARTEAGEAAVWCEILVSLKLIPLDDALTTVTHLERVVKMLSAA